MELVAGAIFVICWLSCFFSWFWTLYEIIQSRLLNPKIFEKGKILSTDKFEFQIENKKNLIEKINITGIFKYKEVAPDEIILVRKFQLIGMSNWFLVKGKIKFLNNKIYCETRNFNGPTLFILSFLIAWITMSIFFLFIQEINYELIVLTIGGSIFAILFYKVWQWQEKKLGIKMFNSIARLLN